jgi:phosphatidylglycerophosphatase A
MAETTKAPDEKKSRVALWIATGFGLGYLPVAPGTWGSLGGLAIGWALARSLFCTFALFGKLWEGFGVALPLGMSFETFFMLPYVAGTVFFSLVGVWAAQQAANHFRKSDPGQIVVDEIAGQMITYLPVLAPAFIERGGWKYVLVGFILFRIFDIVKPPPARQAEKWPHGWGIMADDWFAGVYAALILWLVHRMAWLG